METGVLALVCRAGEARFAVPVETVARVLAASAFARLPGLPGATVGLVNVGGENLPLVDARVIFSEASRALEPDQHFVELRGSHRFLLWVDAAERVVKVESNQRDALEVGPEAPVQFALRLERETVALLQLEAIDPGPVLRPPEG